MHDVYSLTGEMSLGHPDGEAIAFLTDAIHWAADIGARTMAGPFCSAVGYLPGRRVTSAEWKRCIENLQSLGPVPDDANVVLLGDERALRVI